MGKEIEIKIMNEYNNPFFSIKDNLEMAVGEIKFKDLVIENLRNQIKQLRTIIDSSLSAEEIDVIQYKYQK